MGVYFCSVENTTENKQTLKLKRMTQKLLLCALTCAVSLQAAQPIAANAATHRVFGNKWLQTVNLFRGQNTDALFAAQDNNTEQPALSLSTSHFEVGQAIDIQFKNLPEGASICLFKDKGLVALKTQYKQSADGEQNGTFNVGNDLDEGDYTVRCLDAKGKTLGNELLFTVNAIPFADGPKDILVMSDIHVMNPELLVKEGSAFNQYLASDRKLLAESKDIYYTMIDTILARKPELVLIPGDLTKDGELLSHQMVAEQLKRLKQAGIQTLVVPGNHDVNNPHAWVFDGDTTSYAQTVSANDFAEIYKDFGYGDKAVRDTHSLSYAIEPLDGVVVIGIDACRYEDNTFKSEGAEADVCVTSGRIKPETLAWIQTQAREARSKGKQVLGVMHHNLVEHFNAQATIAAPYVVDEAAEVRKALMEAGVRVVFTGHFHIQDVAKDYNETRTDSIYDVSTGSTVTYPCPFRLVRLNDDNSQMDLQGKYIKSVNLGGELQKDFGGYAQQKLVDGLMPMIGSLVADYWDVINEVVNANLGSLGGLVKFPETPEALTEMLVECLGEEAVQAYLTFSESNEHKKDGAALQESIVKGGIDKLVDKLVGPLLGKIAKPIVHAKVDPLLNTVLGSLLGNITHYGTENANLTNDMDLSIRMPKNVVNQIGTAEADKATLQVSPTITKGDFTVGVPAQTEAQRLCVYDLNGRVVANRNIEAGAPAECHFHFEQKGTYLVKLIGGGKAVKVIVE